MSNVMVFNPAQLPAFARKGELSAMAKNLAGSGPQGKRISIKAGVFRLIAEGKEVAKITDRHLDVVFVNAAEKISRTFYLSEFDDANPSAPDCWSVDGTTPDPKSTNKQCDTCAACPQNAKGSGKGDSKACRYSQRVAVVLANDIEGDVMQLSLPGASLFGKGVGDNRPLQAYSQYLMAQGIDPAMLVTRMSFDMDATAPKLFFKAMRWLTDDEYATVVEQGKSPEAIQAVTMTVAQIDKAPAPVIPGAKPKPRVLSSEDENEEPPVEPPAPAPKPKAKAKPAPAPEPEADAGEPEVRNTAPKPNAVPAAKSSLAATLSDWDTDD